jgi:hypothetical protein
MRTVADQCGGTEDVSRRPYAAQTAR